MRTLTRLLITDGDASGLLLLICGLLAFAGLVARMCGAWA